jgi:hypothetical protein
MATWEFAFELLILAVHPPPYFEREYTVVMLDMLLTKANMIEVRYMVGDFLFAFMLLRVYFLVRTLLNLNLFSELTSKRICGKHQVQTGPAFCIKALIKERPGFTVTIIALISLLWLSYLLRIFERIAYESQGIKVFDSYFTSMWCVIITMTTVGYGDVYSTSTYGRCISILNALWGTFLISCLVASIGRAFELSDDQLKAIEEIKRKKKLRRGYSIKTVAEEEVGRSSSSTSGREDSLSSSSMKSDSSVKCSSQNG